MYICFPSKSGKIPPNGVDCRLVWVVMSQPRKSKFLSLPGDYFDCGLGEPEETDPFGMKGIGEVAMNDPLPAVANDVADACGVRICHGSLMPERVMAGQKG